PSLPFWLVAVIDLSFFPAVALVLALPILASKNYRNLPFLVMLLLLFTSNVLMYLQHTPHLSDILPAGQFGLGQTIALRTITLMMLVMGGRIIPLFTRNATRREKIAGNPRVDRFALGVYLVATLLTIVLSSNEILG